MEPLRHLLQILPKIVNCQKRDHRRRKKIGAVYCQCGAQMSHHHISWECSIFQTERAPALASLPSLPICFQQTTLVPLSMNISKTQIADVHVAWSMCGSTTSNFGPHRRRAPKCSSLSRQASNFSSQAASRWRRRARAASVAAHRSRLHVLLQVWQADATPEAHQAQILNKPCANRCLPQGRTIAHDEGSLWRYPPQLTRLTQRLLPAYPPAYPPELTA